MAQNENSKYKHLSHGFGPYFDSESRVLVLGSFPSVKSRELNFYYGHPMNRFWPMLGEVFHMDFSGSVDSKKEALKTAHIALYDVIDSCDIVGSSDASIKNTVITDLLPILQQTKINRILLNGKKAGALFERYQKPIVGSGIQYVIMPSTSPANAAIKMEELISAWEKELKTPCTRTFID